MLKHHPKLKKEWERSRILTAIAGRHLLTGAFEKELLRIINKESTKGNRFKSLIESLRKL